mmetsp:Transcript_18072/g.32124  ORF Transcript_18072/g.32124 Transcript_18072/m.32124 type:complete len:95 (+) Transcript_18072:577-861(+)
MNQSVAGIASPGIKLRPVGTALLEAPSASQKRKATWSMEQVRVAREGAGSDGATNAAQDKQDLLVPTRGITAGPGNQQTDNNRNEEYDAGCDAK